MPQESIVLTVGMRMVARILGHKWSPRGGRGISLKRPDRIAIRASGVTRGATLRVRVMSSAAVHSTQKAAAQVRQVERGDSIATTKADASRPEERRVRRTADR